MRFASTRRRLSTAVATVLLGCLLVDSDRLLVHAQSCAVPAKTLSFDCGDSCSTGSACMLKPASSSASCECFARTSATRFTFLIPFDSTVGDTGLTLSKSNAELTKIAKWTLPTTTTEVLVRGGSSLTISTRGTVANVEIADDFVAASTDLTVLTLENIDLSASISTLVPNLPSGLKELHLQNAVLTAFPAGASRFKSLQTLELTDNYISQVDQSNAIDSLVYLHLDFNRIQSFLMLFPKLTYLNLVYNKLSEVPAVIAKYTTLQSLHLSGNPINEFKKDYALGTLDTLGLFETNLSEFDVYLPSLKTLYLELNNLKEIPPIVFSHARLKKLYLRGNNLMTNVVLTNAQANFIATLDDFSINDSAFSTSCAVSQQAKVKTFTVCIAGGAVDMSVINGPRVVVSDPALSSKTANASSSGGSNPNTTTSNSSNLNSTGSTNGNNTAASTSGDAATDRKTTPRSSTSTNSSAAMTIVVVSAVGAFVVALFIGFTMWKRGRSANSNKSNGNGNGNDNEVDGSATDDSSKATTPSAKSSSVAARASGAGRSDYSSVWSDPDMLAVKIDANEIVDINRIGQGGFCDVWLVLYRQSQHLASKRLRYVTRDRTQDFIKEIKLVATLQHHRIVELVGAAWTKETDLQALFEYMDGGDLRTYLTDDRHPRAWSVQKIQIAIDVVEALVYVHSFQPPLVHRDLKSRNVLLSGSMDAKLTDFGIARYRSEQNTMTAGVGTSRWLAPEVISGKRNYGPAADIFSFGVVLSELDSHKLPYEDATAQDGSRLAEVALMQMVALGELRPSLSPSCPPEIAKLVGMCLSLDPDERPSTPEVAYALRSYRKAVDSFIV